MQQNFCFCWANHTWKKSWNGTQEILIEQTYGEEVEWKEHLDYLMNFFKDERYIKIDNKPIFIIYAADEIENCEKRIKFYDDELKKNGFDGIYFIETQKNRKYTKKIKNSQSVLIREPSVAFTSLSVFSKIINRIRKKMGVLLCQM